MSMLYKVELWVELWWNYMKFHPNSTHNSTTNNLLIIKAITTPRWKGGTSNDKKYFSENMAEEVLTAVKKKEKYSWYTHFHGFFCVLLDFSAPVGRNDGHGLSLAGGNPAPYWRNTI